MNRLLEIDNADRLVKDLEVRLNTATMNLQVLEREIDALSTSQAQLESNVKYLKKNKVVTLALEYRRTKDELAKVKLRLSMIKTDRENLRQAYKQIGIALDEARKNFDKLLRGSSNNVVRHDFRKKNDGKG